MGGAFPTGMRWDFPSARSPAARARVVLPPYAPGMRIGLFGGTFDPPHAAHRAACLLAMHRLGLDRVWWLVTPGNPLKDTRGLAPLGERIAAARALAASSVYQRDRFRSPVGHALHLRNGVLPGPPLPRRTLCLDHGRRQFAQLPPLATVAGHRRTGTDRNRRSAWSEPVRHRERGRPDVCARAPTRGSREGSAGTKTTGMDLFAWPQIAVVVDRAARGAGTLRGRQCEASLKQSG